MIRTTLASAILMFAALAGAQTFKPEHKYTIGDADAYAIKVNATSSAGAIVITSEMAKNVKKIYDNGDADIETVVSNLAVSLEGSALPIPTQQKPSTTLYNKFGMPISAARQSLGLSFMRFGTFYGDKELQVGESYKIVQSDEKNPKNHYSGTAKLLSVEDGKAKLAITIDSVTETSETPMHLEGTATVDAANDRLISFKGTAKNVPATAGIVISTAEFSMERK